MNKMNKLTYILTALLIGGAASAGAQSMEAVPEMQLADTLDIGYGLKVSSPASTYSISGVNASAFEKSPYIDISKALYGKIAGLNVTQGTGSSFDNISSLSIHGHAPLILVDGFPRDISEISALEIESCYVLKDAAATALYGMRGANGVVMITTKRGKNQDLKIKVDYTFGVNTQFRAPEFADAYTYATSLNTALANDGLAARYNAMELEAFRTGKYPYEYPNVNWWDETLNDVGFSHKLNMNFTGGNERFRYFTAINYYRDHAMYKKNMEDDRYNTSPTDTRLSIRTNIDVNITPSTTMLLGLMGKLQEDRGNYYDWVNGNTGIMSLVYNTPSAAYPIRYANGIYGGNEVYPNNPVARLKNYGHRRVMYGTLLGDLRLRQTLDAVTKGLGAEVAVSVDNIGAMYELSSKDYQYMSANPQILADGTLTTTPVYYSENSELLGHSQGFSSLEVRSDFQAKVDYNRLFGKHAVQGAVVYDMQSITRNGRNMSQKNQSIMVNATYTYDDRYSINAVFNHAGSAYLPDGDKFDNYPAVSVAWIASNEEFMKNLSFINFLKVRASYGLSGWDGSLTHELWRSYYIGGRGYNFGSSGTNELWGYVEGTYNGNTLPVIGLVAERSEKATVGFDLAAFNNRLNVTVDGFYEKRSDMLVSGTNTTSGIIGITAGSVCEGIYKYRGFDAAVSWNDKVGELSYGIGATMSYLNSEVVNENQGYEEYDYLYTKGNRVGQMYGLEAIGFFNSQQEINNSPQQTFSDVAPGDVKYKDQNGDNIIDDRDVVRMFGSSLPRFYFGFNLNFEYRRFELSADFQGMTGVTISLLNSPLYQPLVNNGNISQTFLDEEVCWSPENKANATMPRLTTQSNANNYQNSSLWYRDGSFIKLRNLTLAYTFPKSQTRFADVKVFVQGTNLFSLDNIGFADPEQLGVAYPSTRSYWAGVKLNF